MAELYIIGHGNATLNNTIDAVDQNNSTYNSKTYGHQFGKTCYNDFIYFYVLHFNFYSPY